MTTLVTGANGHIGSRVVRLCKNAFRGAFVCARAFVLISAPSAAFAGARLMPFEHANASKQWATADLELRERAGKDVVQRALDGGWHQGPLASAALEHRAYSILLDGGKGFHLLVTSLDAGRHGQLSMARLFGGSDAQATKLLYEKVARGLIDVGKPLGISGRQVLRLIQVDQCEEALSKTWMIVLERGKATEVGSFNHEAMPCGGAGPAATASLEIEKGEGYLLQKVLKSFGADDGSPRGKTCEEKIIRRLRWDRSTRRFELGPPRSIGGDCPPGAVLKYGDQNFDTFELPKEIP